MASRQSVNMTVSVLLQLIVLFRFCGGDTVNHLDNTLSAVEKLVDYYEKNFPTLNLDGIYGLRVLEGQTALILERYASGQIHNPNPDWVWQRLVKMRDTSHNISELAIKSLQETEPDYYKQMQWIVDNPMKFAKDYRRLDPSLKWPDQIKKKGETLQEKVSDKCMHELMGSEDNAFQKCSVSENCLIRMLQRGNIEYTLTHQLLYTIVAEQNGCEKNLEQYLRREQIADSISAFQLDLCTNNFFEVRGMIENIEGGEIYSVYHDLFMEQLFVCPVLGFTEFLHADWLYQVLSWQLPPGCYGKAQTGRKLLFEKEVQDGCLSHKTAVATAALSQFLRFLVDPGTPDFQLYSRIDGRNHLLAHPVLIGQGRGPEQPEEPEEVEPALRDGQLQAVWAQVAKEEAEEKEVLKRQARWESRDRPEEEDEEEHVELGAGRLNRMSEEDEGEEGDEGDSRAEEDVEEDEGIEFQAKNPLEQEQEADREEEERVLLRGGHLNRLDDKDTEAEDEDEDQDAPHYYSDDDENDEHANHLQKAAVVAAKQPMKFAKDDEEEDKQYIDDNNAHEQGGGGGGGETDESRAHQLARPLQNAGSHNSVREINDDVYNDYDDSRAQKMQQPPLLKLVMTTPASVLMMQVSDDNSMALGYGLILGSMTVVLLLMYRFIRKRRILIKYRYR